MALRDVQMYCVEQYHGIQINPFFNCNVLNLQHTELHQCSVIITLANNEYVFFFPCKGTSRMSQMTEQ